MSTTIPLPRQRRSIRTRDRLVDAALRAFAESGYRETSMDDICARAQCSKGGLYHHFPTKMAVLEEVVEQLRRLDGLTPPLNAASGATGLPVAALESLLLDLWAEASRSPALQTLLHDSSQPRTQNASALLQIGAMIEERTQALAAASPEAREVA